jgi:Protein of unknown function (DUF3071)
MVHLRLTGVSEDGRTLLLVSDAGVEFTVDVDVRLRDAVSGKPPEQGGDQARTGQWETQMESSLRPRDIQARIRAGETAESVAQVAGTSVDKVMPYATPVLAERAHVAQRAQRASVRRRPAESGAASSARTLGDAVGSHLRSRNVDPDTVSWDAWRREDGRWTLTGSYATTGRVGAAHFSFDAPGNYVVADDDDAHWLLGEVPDAVEAPADPARDDLADVRRRHLSAVPPDELPLGEDAIELVSQSPAPEVAHDRAEENAALGAEIPVEAYLEDTSTQPTLDETFDEPAAEAADESVDETSDADQPRPEPPGRKPVKKTRGRASVPSWDEIMFGGPSDGGGTA